MTKRQGTGKITLLNLGFVISRFAFHISYCDLTSPGWKISFVIPRTSLCMMILSIRSRFEKSVLVLNFVPVLQSKVPSYRHRWDQRICPYKFFGESVLILTKMFGAGTEKIVHNNAIVGRANYTRVREVSRRRDAKRSAENRPFYSCM